MTKQSSLIRATQTNNALTHNGAITHSTSSNNLLDMFFLAGASRNMSEKNIIALFEAARSEDVNLSYKILFWARDAREGAGERRFFQIISRHVLETYPKEWSIVYSYVPEFGYWKDILKIEEPNENNLSWFAKALADKNNLLAKWLPRKGKWFVALHKHMELTPKQLRKKLVKLTDVVENKMCLNEWNKIDYKTVPSVAMNMYRTAFFNHDSNRFTSFNQSVIEGKTKVNASVLFPHSLYQAFNKGQDKKAIEAQWKSLPDFMKGSKERLLPVCDVSGSMYGTPMDVSVALGCYISERNKGIFKDAFITFSSKPSMNYLKGNIISRFQQLQTASWGMSTNLEATFNLILNSALKHKISQKEMPTKILIISDMEFNQATSNRNNFDNIKMLYENAGYKMPGIIFWNVNGRLGNVPVKVDTPNTGLVSGFSPSILTSILGGKGFTPLSIMMETVNKERYSKIAVK